ncbi:MAG: hypothetical protein DYG89_42180 [Caldilinea sp. CFX5]|nr:hypothetical protein [Caldilinea sp. CFX5]
MNDRQRVQMAGRAYAIGGGLWFALAVGSAITFGGDPPGTAAAFTPIQVTWIIAQLLLLYGFFGIRWGGGLGRGRFGAIAFGLGVIGHLLFIAAESHSLLQRATSDLLPLAAIVSALGILLTGIAVLRAKAWQGWTRWMPLLTGLYPWLGMFPFIVIADEPNLYAIGGWGLLRLALGLAIRRQGAGESAPMSAPVGTLLQRSV